MKVWKHFERLFIPSRRNKYKPYFLRLEVAAGTALIIFGLFLGAMGIDHILITTNSPQVAAVVSATLVDLANTDRTENGLLALTVSPTLQNVAQMKADDMAAKSYFAHDSPDGHDPWYWFQKAGYNFSYAGENLAVYFSDSNDVNAAWMNSSEHRANILNEHFTEIGIAVAQGTYQGQPTVFVVQEFGTPSALATAAPLNAPQVADVSKASPARAVALAHAPTVAGADEEPLKIIAQTDTFIAVKSEKTPVHSVTPKATPMSASVQPSFFPGMMGTIATSPQTVLRIIYEIIAAIVILALVLDVVVEIGRFHVRHITHGLSLLMLMVVLLYVGGSFFVGHLMIV